MQRQDYTPIYVRIQDFIRGEIASGQLSEGDRMLSEPELAEKFSTTRATVSKAMQKLVFDGVVIRRPGSGTFVASQSLNAPLDLTHVQSFEEQVRAQGRSTGYEMLRFGPRPATEREALLLHQDPGAEVWQLDRLRLVSGQPVGVEMRVIPGELGARIAPEMLSALSLHEILERSFGLSVHRVEGRIRAGLVPLALAARLKVPAGAPVLIRDYVLLSRDRRPLVCGESLYREEYRIDYVVQQAVRARPAPE